MQTSKRNIHFITTLPIHPLFINEDAPKNTPQNEPQQTHSAINTKTAANK